MFYTQSSDKSRSSLLPTLAVILPISMIFSSVVLTSLKNNVQNTQSLFRQEPLTLAKAASEKKMKILSTPSTIPSHNQTKRSVLNLTKVLPDNDDLIIPPSAAQSLNLVAQTA